jgi:hypothetical protein|tara:strand:- start:18423 stop:19163 length:741 start_codon:yes stop_codon:yes gene_type:complete
MSQKILAISGAKQSGKTTCAKFLYGYEMKRNNVIEQFEITDDGRLLVNASFTSADGEKTDGMGVFDIFRGDYQFIEYASTHIWPHIKAYNFADSLKSVAIELFGLTYEQCYGTEEEKNTYTTVRKPNGTVCFMAREFLQYFGTNVCRTLKPDIWTSFCLNQVEAEQSKMAVIADCRFPNEAEAIQSRGGKVVRLTRELYEDSHQSEVALKNYGKFDVVIDNTKMTIKEQNEELLAAMLDWGWVESV